MAVLRCTFAVDAGTDLKSMPTSLNVLSAATESAVAAYTSSENVNQRSRWPRLRVMNTMVSFIRFFLVLVLEPDRHSDTYALLLLITDYGY